MQYPFLNTGKVVFAIVTLVVLATGPSCKSKIEKKDKSLEAMQNQDNGKYTPILDSADTSIVYKNASNTDLHLNIYFPENQISDSVKPCIIFFFGGGFINGSPNQFEEQCKYFSDLGLVAISADYRVISRNNTTGIECIEDAKSAIRFLRINASALGVDPSKIIAAGGSAGGALCITSAIDNPIVNDPQDDISISCKPDYMILFNPVVHLEEFAFRVRKFPNLAAQLNPLKNIQPGMPPAIIMHGTEDEISGFAFVEQWTADMQKAGNDVTLIPYTGMEHGFFQRNKNDGKYYTETLEQATIWIKKQGLL